MKNKVYSKEEAKELKKKLDKASLATKNKKALSRRCAEDIKSGIEIDRLLEHDDKLYYESLLD
jgi:hypothetical protein